MVPTGGIKPPHPEYKTGVLSLNEVGMVLVREVESR